MKEIVLILCSFVLMNADGFEYTDCGSKLGQFINATVSTCKNTDPYCKLYRGKNATLQLDFIANKDDSSVEAIAEGIISGMEVHWPLSQPDACKNSGLVCPLHPGNSYRYVITFPLAKNYPTIHLDVEWQLRDNNLKSDIICIRFPVKIE